MKSPIVGLALGITLLAPAASFAQGRGPLNPPNTGRPSASPRPYAAPQLPFARTPSSDAAANDSNGAPADPKVFAAEAALPSPVPPDQIKPITIELPKDPIEPYLLTKDAGPFMVMAKTFRGPEAERFALALVLELRREFGLPAYVLRSKDFPGKSNIRGVPPTAPEVVRQPQLTDPEKVRTYDEAAVLVGDEKTLDGSEKLLHRVKKIKPKCIDGMPSIFAWRKGEGLAKAIRTTNPFVPAQNLFPGKHDKMIMEMNDGPRSLFRCPGRYTLQIAEFGGRSTLRVDDARTQALDILKRSPLATAAEDAEKLADALAKAAEIKQMGQPIYVYHDRTSSKVTIGSFNAPNDPAALKLRESLLRQAISIMDSKDQRGRWVQRRGIDKMIVPATFLTDLDDPNTPIRPKDH